MDVIDFLRYALSLLVVLGLLAGFAYALKRGWAGALLPGGLAGAPRRKRLAVQETLLLDPRRRVVIVRVDAEEHVLLLGAGAEQVLARRPVAEAEAAAGFDAALAEAGDAAPSRERAA